MSFVVGGVVTAPPAFFRAGRRLAGRLALPVRLITQLLRLYLASSIMAEI